MDPKTHWQTIYGAKRPTEVSWFQREATVSLQLIRQAAAERSTAVIDVGAGASTLVDSLVELGYQRVAVLDIAENALAQAKARLGTSAAKEATRNKCCNLGSGCVHWSS